ncbi:MAG: cupin [Proteobacteria bacterium]|nr:cupin [Pseudomonadota bacterium]
MKMPPDGDFAPLDLHAGWIRAPGYPEGVEYKVLAGALDEIGKTGHRTTLTRFRPGALLDRVQVHDYVEEVIALDGELLWLNEDGSVRQRITRNHYVCRPAGVPHGPFRSERGYLSLQVCYYREKLPRQDVNRSPP